MGRRDDHASAGDVDFRHRIAGERQHEAIAVMAGYFEDLAGAEVMQRRDLTDRHAVRELDGKADQVGLIKFIARGLGQGFSDFVGGVSLMAIFV